MEFTLSLPLRTYIMEAAIPLPWTPLSSVHSLIYKIHETEKSESETPCSQNTFTHTQMQITNLKTKHKQQGEEAKIEIKHVVVELAVHYCLSCKTIINHLLCKY